jgi:short-subunit dehydrogenase
VKPLAIKNSWVLVTGASTGLGRASALRLAASYQAKPLIVGRRLDNLRELQTEIDERFNVPCEIIVADQREIEGREKIAAKVAELQVTAALLVAGMTSVGSFDAGRADTYAEVIETNILGFTDLLARLIAIFREQPFESSVIAVSSLAGETSVPFQAVRRVESLCEHPHASAFRGACRDGSECWVFCTRWNRHRHGCPQRFEVGEVGFDGR